MPLRKNDDDEMSETQEVETSRQEEIQSSAEDCTPNSAGVHGAESTGDPERKTVSQIAKLFNKKDHSPCDLQTTPRSSPLEGKESVSAAFTTPKANTATGTPGAPRKSMQKCHMCLSHENIAEWSCQDCRKLQETPGYMFCAECDKFLHGDKRSDHQRVRIQAEPDSGCWWGGSLKQSSPPAKSGRGEARRHCYRHVLEDGDDDDLPKEVCMPRSPKSFVAHLRSSTSNEDTLVSLIFTEEMLLVRPKSSSDTVSANTVLHTLNFSSGVQAFPV